MAAAKTVLDRFEVEYQQYHGLSAQRIRRQRAQLEAFERFVGKPLIEATADDFGQWMSSLVSDGNHPNTVRTKGNMIRPFFSWAFEKDLIDGNALMKIRAVKNPKGASGKTLPKPYTSKELKRWRDSLNDRYPFLPDFKLNYWTTGRSSYKRVADHALRLQLEAIIALALYGGMRKAEIFVVSIDDIHPDNEYIAVHGKGGKPREVPHTKQTRERIGAWLDFRTRLDPPHDDPWLSLAPNQPEGGWLKSIRWRRFEELVNSVPGDWRLHRFRHTAATNWLRAGMPLEQVQKLLGHANIQQTLCYAEIVRDDLSRTVADLEDTFEQQINAAEAAEEE